MVDQGARAAKYKISLDYLVAVSGHELEKAKVCQSIKYHEGRSTL